jgi:hypothetical protein
MPLLDKSLVALKFLPEAFYHCLVVGILVCPPPPPVKYKGIPLHLDKHWMRITEKPKAWQREDFASSFRKRPGIGRIDDWGLLLAERISLADAIPVKTDVLGLHLHYRKMIKGNNKLVNGRIFELDALIGCTRR